MVVNGYSDHLMAINDAVNGNLMIVSGVSRYFTIINVLRKDIHDR